MSARGLMVAGLAAAALAVAGAKVASGARVARAASWPAAAPRAGVVLPEEIDTPVPADVRAEVTAEGGALRVTVRRSGHVIALEGAGVRTAGSDWAALRVEPAPGGGATLVWEATDPRELSTARGIVHVGERPPRLAMASPPEPVREFRERAHRCRAHARWAGGYAVLCRIAAKPVRVASPIASRPLEDVWVLGDVIRLDLPVSPGEAVGRMVTYADRGRGVVVRAEASWVAGEARPVLAMGWDERIQPVPETP